MLLPTLHLNPSFPVSRIRFSFSFLKSRRWNLYWIGITPFSITCAFIKHTRFLWCNQKMLIKTEAYYFFWSHQTTILSSKFLIIVISRDSAIFFHFCQLFYMLYSPLALSSRNFCWFCENSWTIIIKNAKSIPPLTNSWGNDNAKEMVIIFCTKYDRFISLDID